jgi:hypothetical protein
LDFLGFSIVGIFLLDTKVYIAPQMAPRLIAKSSINKLNQLYYGKQFNQINHDMENDYIVMFYINIIICWMMKSHVVKYLYT